MTEAELGTYLRLVGLHLEREDVQRILPVMAAHWEELRVLDDVDVSSVESAVGPRMSAWSAR